MTRAGASSGLRRAEGADARGARADFFVELGHPHEPVHPEIRAQGQQRMPEGRGMVSFEEEMSDPGETVRAGERSGEQGGRAPDERVRGEDQRQSRAGEMQAPVGRVQMPGQIKRPELVEARELAAHVLKFGEGGIRTLGTRLHKYNGLANRRFQPLTHLSIILIIVNFKRLFLNGIIHFKNGLRTLVCGKVCGFEKIGYANLICSGHRKDSSTKDVAYDFVPPHRRWEIPDNEELPAKHH